MGPAMAFLLDALAVGALFTGLLISNQKQWFQQTRLVLFAAAGFFSCPAMAQQTTSGPRWFDQDTMTGDWGGERTSLRDAGI